MSKVGQNNQTGRGGGGQGQNRQQGLRNNQNNNSPRTSISGGGQQQNNNNKANNNAKSNPNTTSNNVTANNTNNPVNSTILAELKGSLSKPVRLTLEDGKQEIGFLWTYDVGMSVVVLEIPEQVGAALNRRKNEAKKYLSSAIVSHSKPAVSNAKQQHTSTQQYEGKKTNFEIIKFRTIQRVERLPTISTTEANGGGAKSQPSQQVLQAFQSAKMSTIKGDINVVAAEARERLATGEALKRLAKIGVGVSKLGQDVFDALSKTLPCRWADQHIIVMDEFVISPEKYEIAVIPNVPLATLQAIAEGKEVTGAPEEARGQATRWQRVMKVLEGERRKILANNNV